MRQKQKNIRSSWHLVALCEHPSPSFSDHVCASVSVSVDLSTEAHAVKYTDAQRCVARKNRLVEHVPGFFCQHTHIVPERQRKPDFS